MKKDIINREDIEQLVDVFYQKVRVDPQIGFFFTKIEKVDWNKHLPVMYNFWENVLFHTASYDGNPMERHQTVHSKCPMKKEHFEHWVTLFTDTVDELFAGKQADQIRIRARNIAQIMHANLKTSDNENTDGKNIREI